jgi:hypothetical protein
MLYGFWVFNFPVYILSDSILFGFHFCRIRLVAVATQKFVAEVASDSLQYATELFVIRYTKIHMQMHKV